MCLYPAYHKTACCSRKGQSMSQPKQLTIQQAIPRAKKAAKKGKITDLMEIYTAILQQRLMLRALPEILKMLFWKCGISGTDKAENRQLFPSL